MAVEFQIMGGDYEAYSPLVNNQECVNLYPIIDQSGGVPAALYPTPGLKLWKRFEGNHYQVRHLQEVKDDFLLAVIGDTLYLISPDKQSYTVSGTLSGTSGRLIVASDQLTYFVVLDIDKESLYYVDFASRSLNSITLPPTVVATGLAYQDGYWIISNKDSDYFYISDLSDPSTWGTLNYKAAEYQGDKIVAIISDHDELITFGTKTTEYFYNSGGSTGVPFSKIAGSQQEVGIAGPTAYTACDNTLYFLDNLGHPSFTSQYSPKFLPSTHISYQMGQLDTIDDCFMFSYVFEGHSFVVFTFPTENKTWVYDISTGAWHRRASYPYDTDGRWRANCYEFFNRKHLVGDYENGIIYELDHDVFTENDEIMPALRQCPVISAKREHIIYNSLELHIQAGVGIATGQGEDPVVMMQYSDNHGRTFSNELWRSIGKIGEFDHRVIWSRLGRSLERVYRFKITDPTNRVIIGSYLNNKRY